jgi:biopolymer transport protein ExbB
MLETKKTDILIALLGAAALLTSAPAFAQATPAAETPAAATATTDPAAPAAGETAPVAAEPAAADDDEDAVPTEIEGAGELTIGRMITHAAWVEQVIMAGLAIASVISWILLFSKLFEFAAVNKQSDRFLEAFRGARTVADMRRISTSEEFEGNPLADMAAAAAEEVELSRQAGLQVNGEHRETTIARASQAITAVQSQLAKRLSGGQQFLASTGATSPFIGLLGTVYGIMTSFIGIANANTTNLAVVAPGISTALLATGIGLFAAIPAVIFYNYFQTRIAAYGTRAEGFAAELMNGISRQLDKGA